MESFYGEGLQGDAGDRVEERPPVLGHALLGWPPEEHRRWERQVLESAGVGAARRRLEPVAREEGQLPDVRLLGPAARPQDASVVEEDGGDQVSQSLRLDHDMALTARAGVLVVVGAVEHPGHLPRDHVDPVVQRLAVAAAPQTWVL